MKNFKPNFFYGTVSSWLFIFFVFGGMWGCPQYRVYQQRLEGEAELARAQQNRQIKMQEASAKKQAAMDLAIADTTRAWGIAKSNEIIGESLTDEYTRWLFVDQLDEVGENTQIIYVPTEANIPVLEANRLKNGK
jgi:regulator of protease activity HflC (stomatin/prohibitin superfamily)